MKTPINKARNLGPLTEAELNSVGINSLEEIIELGWEETFLKLVEIYPERINLNMATALIGAVEDCDWRKVPGPLKSEAKKLINVLKKTILK